MGISVTFTPVEIESRDVAGATVVVIDCFRASTSIVTALDRGAAAVYTFSSVEEAVEARAARPGSLLAGERGGVKIEGFDLGNSPAEFRSRDLAGAEILMTTTNGTRVLTAAARAKELYVAGFVNAAATSGALAGRTGEVLLAAAGTGGRFAIEDAICAGMLVELLSGNSAAELDDAAGFARCCARRPWGDLSEMALCGAGARNVREAGLEADLADCLALDSIPLVARVVREPLKVVKA